MASVDGCIERAVVLLSDGLIDIDQVDPKGCTPLMLASYHGHSHVVRILLNKRANVSIVAGGGFAALHAYKPDACGGRRRPGSEYLNSR